jgi:hypothetical protein
MSAYTCEFCRNEYSNQSTLKLHQRTAKFCLDLQKRMKDDYKEEKEEEDSSIKCEYCNKTYTLKANLKLHLSTCKIRKEKLIEDDLNNKYKAELELYKEKYNQELISIKLNFDTELEEIKNSKKEDQNEIFILKEKIKLLENQVKDYKDQLKEYIDKYDKITDKIIERPVNVYQDNRQNNSNNSNYHIQYNKLFSELTPLTDEYLKESISRIKVNDMIYTNDNAIDFNFACNLVNILKDTVFFTDPSRGKLVFKDEHGNSGKMQAEAYIVECIKRSKPECIELCKRCLDIVRLRQTEFTDEDYGKCMIGISQLSDCINKGKQHNIITEISNKLIKASNSLSRNNPIIETPLLNDHSDVVNNSNSSEKSGNSEN